MFANVYMQSIVALIAGILILIIPSLLNWLRNAFGQTIVTPYSLRPFPKVPISTPLDWGEVDPKLEPSSFNLLTIRHRSKGKDPWGDFWKHSQVLPGSGGGA